ncbi:DNA replication complex GINS family protein [Candidatus Woesearchaeota archaeon]|nr:DNA replication complex GINS family protein [Candidatus Woesearchaeota archaeon]
MNALSFQKGGFVAETIRITLETLYDIFRNEKKREDLQKLEDTFFIDVIGYLREKKALLESQAKSTDVFAIGEREKLEYELRSIRRILKEIYEKREKKIIDIALNKSRTGSDIIDTSAMLREEKELYQELLDKMNQFRREVFLRLLQGEMPRGLSPKPAVMDGPDVQPEMAEGERDMTKIRFLRPTPSFVWKDLKKYGPYDSGEETEIYPEVADLLVRKGRAEKV